MYFVFILLMVSFLIIFLPFFLFKSTLEVFRLGNIATEISYGFILLLISKLECFYFILFFYISEAIDFNASVQNSLLF